MTQLHRILLFFSSSLTLPRLQGGKPLLRLQSSEFPPVRQMCQWLGKPANHTQRLPRSPITLTLLAQGSHHPRVLASQATQRQIGSIGAFCSLFHDLTHQHSLPVLLCCQGELALPSSWERGLTRGSLAWSTRVKALPLEEHTGTSALLAWQTTSEHPSVSTARARRAHRKEPKAPVRAGYCVKPTTGARTLSPNYYVNI